MKGRVAWFNATKGYGFISTPGAPDVFVHIREMDNSGVATLMSDDEVEFDEMPGRNGKTCATKLKLLSRVRG